MGTLVNIITGIGAFLGLLFLSICIIVFILYIIGHKAHKKEKEIYMNEIKKRRI